MFRLFLVLLSFPVLLQGQNIDLLFSQKKFDQVAAQFPDVHKKSGSQAYKIGESLLVIGDFTNAATAFEVAINKNYTNMQVYRGLAAAYKEQERYKLSLKAIDNALKHSPDRKALLLDKGEILLAAGLLDSAVHHYEYLHKAYPKNQTGALMPCKIRHDQSKYQAALECYYKSLPYYRENSPFQEEALVGITLLEWHEFSRFFKANKSLTLLREKFPNKYEYLIWQHQLYNEWGKPKEAFYTEGEIKKAYFESALPSKYYKTGAFLKEEIQNEFFFVQVFQNFLPEKKDGVTHQVFIFNQDGSRGLKEFKVSIVDKSVQIHSNNSEIPLELPGEYPTLKKYILEEINVTRDTENLEK